MESNQVVISFHAKPLKPPILGKSMVERVHKLAIFGMTCGGCSSRAKQVLEANPDFREREEKTPKNKIMN